MSGGTPLADVVAILRWCCGVQDSPWVGELFDSHFLLVWRGFACCACEADCWRHHGGPRLPCHLWSPLRILLPGQGRRWPFALVREGSFGTFLSFLRFPAHSLCSFSSMDALFSFWQQRSVLFPKLRRNDNQFRKEIER